MRDGKRNWYRAYSGGIIKGVWLIKI